MTPFGVLGKEATDLGTAGPHRTPGSSELPPTPADEPAAVTAPRRGRGRPKGQRNKKTGANGSGSTSQPSTPASVLARRSSKIKSSGPGPGEDLSLSLGEPALADSERAGNAGAGAGADIEVVGKTKHLRLKETISSSGSSSVLASPNGTWQTTSPMAMSTAKDSGCTTPTFPSNRKTTHKYAEQRRRDDLKKWFGRLRAIVPVLREAVADFKMVVGENGEPNPNPNSPTSPLFAAEEEGSDEDGYVGRKGAAIRGASKLECLEKTYEYILTLRSAMKDRQDEVDALKKMVLDLGGDPSSVVSPDASSSSTSAVGTVSGSGSVSGPSEGSEKKEIL